MKLISFSFVLAIVQLQSKRLLLQTVEPTCPDNMQFNDCGSACPDTCAGSTTPCIAVCNRGCECQDGYVLESDTDGAECILQRECPCPGGKQWTDCGSQCPLTCDSMNNPSSLCVDSCFEGCQCPTATVENAEGTCVSPLNCPTQQCGDNEQYNACGSACPTTCASLGSFTNCITVCVAGCECQDGYVRDVTDGTCILEEECPTDAPQPTNECPGLKVWNDCASCPTNCDNYGVFSICTQQCQQRCECPSPYIEDENGDCIHPNYCPTVTTEVPECGDNMQYNVCASACPATCASLGSLNPCIAVCAPGCECQDGYVLDVADGACILEEECPTDTPTPQPTPECAENEEYNQCGTACPARCDIGQPSFCTMQCVAGCFCKEGFILDSEDGTCIAEGECPTEAPVTTEETDECAVNEEYNECGTACPARCDTLGSITMCTMQCVSGCFCKDGYVLDGVDGECVSERECSACVQPQVVGPCEALIPRYYYNAASGECEQFSYGGCQGNDNNFATLIDCAGSCTCGENEQYNECATPQDCAATCDTLGEIVPCAAVCEARCECIDGYVLDETDGVCVAESECGSSECVDNAEYITCGSACPDTCGEDPMACTRQCVEGCFCMDGYVLNSDCECVEEEECSSAEQGMEGPVIVQRCAGTTSTPIRNTGGVRGIGGIMGIAFGIMMFSWM